MKFRNNEYKFYMDPVETGKYIRSLRKARGLTGEELGNKIVFSQKVISSWETGRKFPSKEALLALSNYFEVDIHSLILPKDNCPVSYVGYYPNMTNGEWCLPSSFNSWYYLLRKEYLIQKYLSGALSAVLANELFELESLVNFRRCNKSASIEAKYGDPKEVTEKMYVEYVLSNLDEMFDDFYDESIGILATGKPTKIKCYATYNVFTSVFFDLYNDEDVSSTLAAMNDIQKSILFMTAVFYDELRGKKMTKILFDSGARWFSGVFGEVPEDVLEESRYDKDKDYGEDEWMMDDYQKLFPYYVIIQFVAKRLSKMSYDELSQKVVEDDLSLDMYIERLKCMGEINE